MWIVSAGVGARMNCGRTDDFGFHAVEDKLHVHDMHAIIA